MGDTRDNPEIDTMTGTVAVEQPTQAAAQSVISMASELVKRTSDLANATSEGGPRRATVLPSEAAGRSGPEATITMLGMSHPDDMGEFFAAMAMAQLEFGSIEKTMSANVRSRKGEESSFKYDYAPLDEVLGAVRPALAGNGIAVMQFPYTRTNSVVVRTLLAHKSGRYIWNDCVVSVISIAPQDIGSGITYARRYGLQAITGVAPDSDDDGAKSQQRDSWSQPRQQAAPKQSAQKPADAIGKVLVTACRETKQGSGVIYGIKTTDREFWTDDKTIFEQAQAAQAQERGVSIVSERRQGRAPGSSVNWILEMQL